LIIQEIQEKKHLPSLGGTLPPHCQIAGAPVGFSETKTQLVSETKVQALKKPPNISKQYQHTS
jgi:hypothetical protein